MSLVIPVGYCNAAFVFTSSVGTGPFVTTLGVDTGESGGDFVGVANDLKALYASALGGITSNALTLDRVTLSIGVDGPGGSVDSDTAPVAMTGNITSGPMAMAVIARKTTNQFGRYGRGRMFLPGVNSENGIDPDGSVTPAYRTTVQTALNAFFSGMPPEATPVLLHSETIAQAPDIITALTVSDLVGWVRGRIR